MYNKKNIQGATLIETILVIVVAMAILMLSIQQYLSYRRNADVVQLQANVDMLFDSLAIYFRANCSNPNNPLSSSSGNISYPVSLNTLMSDGYLVLQNNTMQVSPLVNTEGASQGYILQFNQTQTNGELPPRTQKMSDGSTVQIGSIVSWQAQVSVNLLNPDTAEQYKDIMNAACLSNLAGDAVTTCNQASGGDYLVFVRGPSRPSSKANSNLWYSMPMVKLFKQEYTTDPMSILVEPSQSKQVSSQYFVCGS